MVNAFRERWRTGHEGDPAAWPMTMGGGEWFEAFPTDVTLGH